MVRESVKNERVMEAQELGELVERLQHYCLFLTKNKWDGEDLCQESICKALKHYPDQSKWSSPLLKKMAYHAWVDKIRKQSKEMLVDAPEKSMEIGSNIDLEPLERLISTLTPKQLVTLVLKEAFQFKISEIACLLDTSDTAVKALLRRTRSGVDTLHEWEDPHDNRGYFEKALQEEMLIILQKSIRAEDPTPLIEQFPEWFRTQSEPKMVSFPCIIRRSSSPSNVLSMAA
ncbi:hypothetical protein LCM10_11830 [Rossellomorea aquimaris]|uniref:sigma factor-like helix-turn-helix DNA-binding protein n=1 Tax=Rossellomorea aquimaris TaxID=189382 RepID=UPI001CD6C30D|nr:sigma factor-like helix-turn-helix DNA-binding protein [Rossellomorea aquimaris]MCA1055676.1 hypothetical protein [Rossellomorea aquimaris]